MVNTLPILVTATLFVNGFELSLRELNGSSIDPFGFKIGSNAVRKSAAEALYAIFTVVCVSAVVLPVTGTFRVSAKVPAVAFTVNVWTLPSTGVVVPSRLVVTATSMDSCE